MFEVIRSVIWRDLTLAWRRRSDVFTTLMFFVIVASLFPLGIGPEPQLLRAIGPGVVWVAALLASMLALSRLFAADYADGTLEQMLLAATPLSVIVIAKVIAHWLAANLPLVLIAPLLGLQFGLPADALAVLASNVSIEYAFQKEVIIGNSDIRSHALSVSKIAITSIGPFHSKRAVG